MWAVGAGGSPPDGQIGPAASSSSIAEAGGERKARGRKINPQEKKATGHNFLALFLFEHF